MNSEKITSANCEKHGDIKHSVFMISVVENGIIKHQPYCLNCIIDLLNILLQEMKFPKVSIQIKEQDGNDKSLSS